MIVYELILYFAYSSLIPSTNFVWSYSVSKFESKYQPSNLYPSFSGVGNSYVESSFNSFVTVLKKQHRLYGKLFYNTYQNNLSLLTCKKQ